MFLWVLFVCFPHNIIPNTIENVEDTAFLKRMFHYCLQYLLPSWRHSYVYSTSFYYCQADQNCKMHFNFQGGGFKKKKKKHSYSRQECTQHSKAFLHNIWKKSSALKITRALFFSKIESLNFPFHYLHDLFPNFSLSYLFLASGPLPMLFFLLGSVLLPPSAHLWLW